MQEQAVDEAPAPAPEVEHPTDKEVAVSQPAGPAGQEGLEAPHQPDDKAPSAVGLKRGREGEEDTEELRPAPAQRVPEGPGRNEQQQRQQEEDHGEEMLDETALAGHDEPEAEVGAEPPATAAEAAPGAPTRSLCIEGFVRPLPLGRVQELLGKTGNLVVFWMNRIKSVCYCTFETEEQAAETLQAVQGLKFPPERVDKGLLAARQVPDQEALDASEGRIQVEAPPAAAQIRIGGESTVSA